MTLGLAAVWKAEKTRVERKTERQRTVTDTCPDSWQLTVKTSKAVIKRSLLKRTTQLGYIMQTSKQEARMETHAAT